MMPNIAISARKGRTDAQKAAMFREVTEAVCRTLDCPIETVVIYLTEFEAEDIAVGGKRRVATEA
jgi:4-oxalocrotonate tautomerase